MFCELVTAHERIVASAAAAATGFIAYHPSDQAIASKRQVSGYFDLDGKATVGLTDSSPQHAGASGYGENHLHFESAGTAARRSNHAPYRERAASIRLGGRLHRHLRCGQTVAKFAPPVFGLAWVIFKL